MQFVTEKDRLESYRRHPRHGPVPAVDSQWHCSSSPSLADTQILEELHGQRQCAQQGPRRSMEDDRLEAGRGGLLPLYERIHGLGTHTAGQLSDVVIHGYAASCVTR